ncbi:hypothetical protein QMA10_14725 [Arthrobacter sp. APC 3897]|uniref:hypothetical protein n=1 Tax=Arthrobacter sp. APC 3897 TaxID=3035204 RepID=UPI0025B425AC|nr:hypothetical protein [Arthrobacter sp. APC 3897]MDN3483169.1 hypothetical protein [Arthrobacter sp. APC 3897]
MEWLAFTAPVLGLVIGMAAGWSTRAGIDRRDESAALNALIMDLHLKRSLAPIEPRVLAGTDGEAALRPTVLDARDRILETLTHLRGGSPDTAVLMRMAAACGLYLRQASRAPERCQFALMELRETLEEGVRLLSDGRRRVRSLPPGERSTAKPGRPPSRTGRRGS